MTKSQPSSLGPLRDGATVVVVGGGPGGTAAAIALMKQGQLRDKSLRVIIVEGKQFTGGLHYNQCAGVLSPPIETGFEEELGIAFPHHLVRNKIKGYVLHTAKQHIVLDDEGDSPSLTLRRVQFDEYMLRQALECGVEIVRARVTGVEFNADEVLIFTENTTLSADAVVGAFGMDAGTGNLFSKACAYRPPPTMNAVVTKYHPGGESVDNFGGYIHAFLPSARHIEFGAITPKGNHLTINIGGAVVNSGQMERFLNLPEVKKMLPGIQNGAQLEENDLSYFRGTFPRRVAQNFSGDRYVMVGDAAGLVRPFKGKGVTAAIQTGIQAAQVMLAEGISARAFKVYHKANQGIIDDLPFGQFTRYITIISSWLGLMDAVVSVAQNDANLRRALFDAVSGYRPYSAIVQSVFTPSTIFKISLKYIVGDKIAEN